MKSLRNLFRLSWVFILSLSWVACSSAAPTQESAASVEPATPVEQAAEADATMEPAMDHSAMAEAGTVEATDLTSPASPASATTEMDMTSSNGEIPADLDTATTQLSEQKLYQVTATSNVTPTLINQLHSWVLYIETAAGQPVEEAEVTAQMTMPQHNPAVSSEPQVTQNLGAGNYLVEGINFSQAGWWQVSFVITAAGQNDRVSFNRVLEELDLATTQLSEQGLFRVTITSKLDPILINQTHEWVLHVETAGGQPVENAEISVNGDMQQHKHGLPTEPQVTQYLGSGDYLVEGVKFQMGGWWTVSFAITANGQSDQVAFNVLL